MTTKWSKMAPKRSTQSGDLICPLLKGPWGSRDHDSQSFIQRNIFVKLTLGAIRNDISHCICLLTHFYLRSQLLAHLILHALFLHTKYDTLLNTTCNVAPLHESITPSIPRTWNDCRRTKDKLIVSISYSIIIIIIRISIILLHSITNSLHFLE